VKKSQNCQSVSCIWCPTNCNIIYKYVSV